MNEDECTECSSTDSIQNKQKQIKFPRKSRIDLKNYRTKSHSRLSRPGILKNGKSPNHHIGRKLSLRRSQSLFDIRDILSCSLPTSSPVKKRSSSCAHRKCTKNEFSEDPSADTGENSSDFIESSDGEIKTFPLTAPANRNVEGRRRAASKQRKQLHTSLRRLNTILIDIHATGLTRSNSLNRKCARLKSLTKQISIPSSEEKLSLENLSGLIDSLSEQLESEVSNFIKASEKDKARLDQVQNDNGILRQRLSTALNMQRNLEDELKQLSRENKLLDAENKNLAIKIVPYLTPDKRELLGSQRSRRNQVDDKVLPERVGFSEEDLHNNNTYYNDEARVEVCSDEFALTSGSKETVSPDANAERTQSSTIIEPERGLGESREEGDRCLTTPPRSNSNDKLEELMADPRAGARKLRESTTHKELDSITSYVRWKTVDFGRLHGRLHKNFQEMQKLKQTMTSMSVEKEEILSDLEVLADSCRDLSRERDNYESILKMILREKNSPESNLGDLLDGLLHHLSRSCVVPNSPPYHHLHSSNCFLESALHVVHEQNISLREEMSKLKETLQRTTGQNSFLQSSNEILTGKVLELQKQWEVTKDELTQTEKDGKERHEKLEGLYEQVLSAKDAFDEQLQEKEKELEEIKTLLESRDKLLTEESEKCKQLEWENENMEKEVAKYKLNVEKMSQVIQHLKASLRDQKGKWNEKVGSASSDLQNTKEHCKWLQTQVDNLNNQLVAAHERIKLHEKDKAILAQKVLSAEEERKTLDRKILEIKSIMHGDTVYRDALTHRNQVLQLEVNRLRKHKLMSDAITITASMSKGCEYSKDCSSEFNGDANAYSIKKETNTDMNGEFSKASPMPVSESPSEDQASNSPVINNKSWDSPQESLLLPIRRKLFADLPMTRAAVSLQQPTIPAVLWYSPQN